MRRIILGLFAAMLVSSVGCVTINVYFPAAAAEKAAEKFIGEVINDRAGDSATETPAQEPPADESGGGAAMLLNLLIPAAHAAEPMDITISTPQIKALRARMQQRFESSLRAWLDAGAIGFSNDGMVELREASAVPLSQRNAVRQTIEAENQDRADVYRLIAEANGHPEWEAKIRATFAKEWIQQAHSGWYYQDSSGAWKRK